ncbi:hypothetical protein AB6813_21490 [bacterium RCC_150]
MPLHLKELALSVARCGELSGVDDAHLQGKPHPCHKVVNAQDRSGGQFQVPEAWAGNLAGAGVVFLSSNPAISAGNPGAKLASKRVPEKYPTVGWDDADIADFMINRFDPDHRWVVDRRHLKVDGSRGSKEPYWGWIEKQTKALLGDDVTWCDEAVMTEVVHCKSNKEHGVPEASAHCARLHLDRILAATGAGLVVVVGKPASLAFRAAYPGALATKDTFAVDGEDGHPDPEHNIFPMVIGSKNRLVCFLWHRGSWGKITDLKRLYPQDFHRLQEAARQRV